MTPCHQVVGPDGPVPLLDLFQGRVTLVEIHREPKFCWDR